MNKMPSYDAHPREERDLFDTHTLVRPDFELSVEDQLAQVELRIATLKRQDTKDVQQKLIELDAKKISLLESRLEAQEQAHPLFVEGLKDWLFTELMSRGAKHPEHQTVDDLMYEEAEVMADMIGELHKDKEPEELKKIAETMRQILQTRREIVTLNGAEA